MKSLGDCSLPRRRVRVRPVAFQPGSQVALAARARAVAGYLEAYAKTVVVGNEATAVELQLLDIELGKLGDAVKVVLERIAKEKE